MLREDVLLVVTERALLESPCGRPASSRAEDRLRFDAVKETTSSEMIQVATGPRVAHQLALGPNPLRVAIFQR
ncbi:MAG TPA: hypothetical protein VMK12_16600 [Anaeromyxobacteraceae bacterium]|nr:hypothetical protein [Anaeromyxobacteraceae bacterium]